MSFQNIPYPPSQSGFRESVKQRALETKKKHSIASWRHSQECLSVVDFWDLVRHKGRVSIGNFIGFRCCQHCFQIKKIDRNSVKTIVPLLFSIRTNSSSLKDKSFLSSWNLLLPAFLSLDGHVMRRTGKICLALTEFWDLRPIT